MLQIIAFRQKKDWNFKNPFISFELFIKSKVLRLSLKHFSLSNTTHSKFFLRCLQKVPLPLSAFDIDQKLHNQLEEMMVTGANIVVSGATGSGKTTFLSSLLNLIKDHEHPILIQDTQEIFLNHPHVTNLLSSQNQIIENLMSFALRMSPTRIAIGELRGKEILGFLTAMNTGHKGVFTTVHASSAFDTIHRLAQLFCLYGENPSIRYDHVLNMVTRNIQFVVYMEHKRVKEIIRIIGIENDCPIFETVYS